MSNDKDIRKQQHSDPSDLEWNDEMRALELMDHSPTKPVRDLFERVLEFPPSDTLSKQELARLLDSIDEILQKHQARLALNEKLSEERVYDHFLKEVLTDEIPQFMVEGARVNFTGCDGCYPECFQMDVCDVYAESDQWDETEVP